MPAAACTRPDDHEAMAPASEASSACAGARCVAHTIGSSVDDACRWHGVRDGLDDEIERHLAAARLGEQGGFTGLYRSLAGPVAGFARSRGVEDVDGLVNEVFLGAFRGLGSFEGGARAFRSWLFSIAWNKIADEHRARSRRVGRAELDPHDVDLPGGNSEDDAVTALGPRSVRDLLDQLTPGQRDVIYLRFVADLSLEETATAIGRPVGAVKALQSRALASLKRILGGAVPCPGRSTMTESE